MTTKNTMGKKTLAVSLLMVVGTVCGADNDKWVTTNSDLYSVFRDLPAEYTGLRLHAVGQARTFTLSQDATGTYVKIDPRSEGTVNLDFSEGSRTMTLSGNLGVINGTGNVNFKKGTWNFATGPQLMYVDPNFGKAEGLNVTADGTSFVSKFFWIFKDLKGTGVSLTLTNGASILTPYDSSAQDHRIYVFAGATTTNAKLFVTGGSQIKATGGNDVYFDYETSVVSAACRGNTALFTGVGSKLVAESAVAYFGIRMGGSTATFDDHAELSASTVQVGFAAGAGQAHLTFTNNAALTAATVNLGMNAGCEDNAIDVIDNATLTATTLNVGKAASHNRLTIDNATLSVGSLAIGKDATASANVCRFRGLDAAFTMSGSGVWEPFAAGHGNRLVFDATDLTFTDRTFEITHGGNEIALENRAQVTLTGHVSSGSEDLRLFVGDGSTFNAAGQFFLAGTNNALVVSNGTFLANKDTQWTFYFGRDVYRESGKQFETCWNNKIVLQGDNPQITSEQDNPTMAVYQGSVFRFELPTTPYKRVPLYGNWTCSADCKIEVVGIDALQRAQVPKHADYVLAQTRNGADIGLNAAVVTAANATLPDGCSLQKSGDKLILHVKAIRDGGLLMILR